MCVIIKSNKNELEVLKSSLKHNFGKDCNFYYPKFKSKSNLLNKTIIKETKILGDYIFCFHKDFVNTSNIKCLNFLRGVKYVLDIFLYNHHLNVLRWLALHISLLYKLC